jgi:alkylation response protein AidB-like acyl-CoA dehydrogenase
MNPDATRTGDSRGLDPAAVIERARGLRELIAAHDEENDREGRIAEPVVDALFASGALSAYVPRQLGGAEMTQRQLLDLISALSYADPSTGWVTMAIAMATGLAGAFFDEETARELFRTPRLAIAGQGTKPGRAEPAAGGYRVSGSWSFASGIKHCTHLHTAARDTETGENRFFIVPVAEVTFIENWDVLGLRGTGSIDYTLDAVFVPREYSYPSLSRTPVTGGDLYRTGIGNFASVNHGAWATGVGRRLLDELAAGARAGSGRAGSIAGNAGFHEQYARAEVELRAASALLHEVWADIEETLARGEDLSVRQESLNRAALNNATWTAHRIAQFAYTRGGSGSLRGGTVQRLFRDVHAGTQHVSSSPAIMQEAGRELAGLAPGERWVHFNLAR